MAEQMVLVEIRRPDKTLLWQAWQSPLAGELDFSDVTAPIVGPYIVTYRQGRKVLRRYTEALSRG